MELVEAQLLPQRVQAFPGQRALCPQLGEGGHALGQEQAAFGFAIAALERADGRVAADGVVLQFLAYHGQVARLPGDGVEVGVGPTEADLYVVALGCQGLYVFDLRFGGAASVVAHAEEAHGVRQIGGLACRARSICCA